MIPKLSQIVGPLNLMDSLMYFLCGKEQQKAPANLIFWLPKTGYLWMSPKGPRVGQGMLDFVEDCCIGVKSH